MTPALLETPLPLILFNTQSLVEVTRNYGFNDLLNNHGMQGIQDIASVLVREGRSFSIVTGLINQPDVHATLLDHLAAFRTARALKRSPVTRLGEPQAGMGDMEVDLDHLKNAMGINYVDLSPEDLAKASEAASIAEIMEGIRFDQEHFDIAPDLTPEDHERSLRLEMGMRRLVRGYSLAGLTFSFDSIIRTPGIETLPFLGISKLMGEGLAYAGEGDLLATAGGILTRVLCGETNFTEMYTMDFNNNSVLDSHMAEGNWRMARRDRKPRLLKREFTLAECKPFASLAFSLEPGAITLFNLTLTADRQFHFITLAAEVADFPPLESLEIPNFKIAFRRDIRAILNEYSLIGGTHHLSLAYGDHRTRFRYLAKILDCQYSDIQTR